MDPVETHHHRQGDEFHAVNDSGRVHACIKLMYNFRLSDSRTPSHISSKLKELAGSNSGLTFGCREVPEFPMAADGSRLYHIYAEYRGTESMASVSARFERLVDVDLARADADPLDAGRHA